MRSEKLQRSAERPWSVPLALTDVPETGRHLELAADAQTRDAIARLAGVRALPRLTAEFDVTLHGRGGLRVTGRVSATVGQVCVVTLESIENAIDEEIDLLFLPSAPSPPIEQDGSEVPVEDAPEVLVDGSVDLGAVATEFLLLAVDPYPRKPGAVFEAPPRSEDAPHPFAALAALKKERGSRDG